jgi:hypothetical protein
MKQLTRVYIKEGNIQKYSIRNIFNWRES